MIYANYFTYILIQSYTYTQACTHARAHIFLLFHSFLLIHLSLFFYTDRYTCIFLFLHSFCNFNIYNEKTCVYIYIYKLHTQVFSFSNWISLIIHTYTLNVTTLFNHAWATLSSVCFIFLIRIREVLARGLKVAGNQRRSFASINIVCFKHGKTGRGPCKFKKDACTRVLASRAILYY